MNYRKVFCAFLSLILSHAAFGGENAAVPWLAPSTPEELKARVEQLRAAYAPYLKSLPKGLDRTRKELPGAWRSKIEVAQFAGGGRPAAPEWWRADFDDPEWEQTHVPEWRYVME